MEHWKPVVGFYGYVVSTTGRVISFRRKEPKYLGLRDNGTGYLYTQLDKNGKQKNKYIHRLVAEAFISNPENKSQVNHINGIKTDNRVENLEWSTKDENIRHSWEIGLREKVRKIMQKRGQDSFGEKHPRSTVTEAQVLEIRKLYSDGMKPKHISDTTKVSYYTVSNIVQRKSWRHLV
jgi:hypothetical protein